MQTRDTKLFYKYQSRAFQFSLDVLSALNNKKSLTAQEINNLSRENGLIYADQVMQCLHSAQIVKKAEQGWQLAPHMNSFRLPPSQIELDYLQYILRLPEVSLFLGDRVMNKLKSAERESFFDPIQIMEPDGDPIPEYPGPEGFRTLLRAIRQGSLIRYSYRTKSNAALSETTALPWKIEYDAFDKRWWIILYLTDEDRTVKARLGNLRDIKLLGTSNIDEEKIKTAVDRLLAPEPIVLEVSSKKGALERCFMVFENQMFTETSRGADGTFLVKFRYYQFDESEIARRLLYLGPMVSIKGPEAVQEKLKALLEMALML